LAGARQRKCRAALEREPGIRKFDMTDIIQSTTGRNSLATAPLVYIYDGRECVGFILARGKTDYEAFDPNNNSVGIFETQPRATNALLIKEGRA
jgi:hypothetical protein